MVRKNHISGKGGTRLIVSCNPISASPPIVDQKAKDVQSNTRLGEGNEVLGHADLRTTAVYVVRVDRTVSSAGNKARDSRARTVEMVAN